MKPTKKKGKPRSTISRQEADNRICGLAKVQRTAEKFGLPMAKTTIRGWRREIRESGPSEYIRTSYNIEREFATIIFETQGLALAVEYLLGRAIDPNRIV